MSDIEIGCDRTLAKIFNKVSKRDGSDLDTITGNSWVWLDAKISKAWVGSTTTRTINARTSVKGQLRSATNSTKPSLQK